MLIVIMPPSCLADIVFEGSFVDTNFRRVHAPAFVRYPIGTHHSAMTRPAAVRTDILCWWGLMQSTSSTEAASHVPLCRDALVPKRPATSTMGPRQVWALSKDLLETRIERWQPSASVTVHFQRPISEVFVLRGAVTVMNMAAAAITSTRETAANDDEAGPPTDAGVAHSQEFGRVLNEGDWCGFPHHTSEVTFDVCKEGATLIVKELLLYDRWRVEKSPSKSHSWSAGTKATGKGFVKPSIASLWHHTSTRRTSARHTAGSEEEQQERSNSMPVGGSPMQCVEITVP